MSEGTTNSKSVSLGINHYSRERLVTDLLEANNRYLLRARASEALLNEALDEILFRSNRPSELVDRLRTHLIAPWNN